MFTTYVNKLVPLNPILLSIHMSLMLPQLFCVHYRRCIDTVCLLVHNHLLLQWCTLLYHILADLQDTRKMKLLLHRYVHLFVDHNQLYNCIYDQFVNLRIDADNHHCLLNMLLYDLLHTCGYLLEV